MKPNIREIVKTVKQFSLADFFCFRKYNFHKNILAMLHVMSLLLFLKEVTEEFKISFQFLIQ